MLLNQRQSRRMQSYLRHEAEFLKANGFADMDAAQQTASKVGRIIHKFFNRQHILEEREDGSRLIHSKAHRKSSDHVGELQMIFRDSMLGDLYTRTCNHYPRQRKEATCS